MLRYDKIDGDDEDRESLLLTDLDIEKKHGHDLLHDSRASRLSSPSAASSSLSPHNLSTEEFAPTEGIHDGNNESANHGRPMSTKRPRLFLFIVFLLYLCEGVPAGLVGATLPLILKPALGFSRTGLFTVCFYPFSLKLLWAPIVDAVWLDRLGRRRTWLIPTLSIEAVLFLAMALMSRQMVDRILDGSTSVLIALLGWCLFVIFLSATQGCVVDGWAVTELPESYHAAASAAHNLGFIVGEFSSNSAFIFLRDAGYVSLSFLCGVFGCAVLGLCLLLLLVPETAQRDLPTGPREAYRVAFRLFTLSSVRRLILVHLLARLAFEVNDSATNLRLLDKGFSTSNIALMTTLDLPFDIASSYIAAWICRFYTPMAVWRTAFVGRLASAIVAMVLVAMSSENIAPSSMQFVLNAANHVLSSSTATIMFIAFLTFHLQVADPVIGSVYMTLLATAQNLGGTLPRAILMYLIDVSTVKRCNDDVDDGRNSGDGKCSVHVDGYLVIGTSCVVVGSIAYFCYMRREVWRLQDLPKSMWLVSNVSRLGSS